MSSQLHSDIEKNTKGRNILLIGSSGNIGRKCLDLLLQHGKASSITLFDKKEPKTKGLPSNVKVLSGEEADITNADAVQKGVKGNDIVICAVGVPRYTAPGEKKLTPYEIEQDGMQHIVHAAKADGVKQIIYISALGVARGDKIPTFHIAHLAKRNAENILIKSGIDYTILRPSGYFFDFRDILAAAVAGRYHVVEGSKARMQPIHQDDMAAIMVASINNKKAKKKVGPPQTPQIMKQGTLAPWLYLLPALVVMSFFIVYPMINTISLSFGNRDGTASAATTCREGKPCWGIFENYRYALTDEFNTSSPQALWSSFWSSSYGNTIKWIIVMVFGTVSVGLAFAVLSDRVKYEPLAKAVLFMPMAISFVGAGVIWRFVYAYGTQQTQIGLLNAVITSLGGDPVAWLSTPPINTFAIIVVGIWIWSGFCMTILSAALKAIARTLPND